jgi:hypothetical protein
MIGFGVEAPGKIAPFFEKGTLPLEDIPDTGKGFILSREAWWSKRYRTWLLKGLRIN